MIMSRNLSVERLKEIAEFPVTYDEELPKMTKADWKDATAPHFRGKAEIVLPSKTMAIENCSRTPGTLKGKFWMSPDFDEPLEDFSEYM